jgi:hypothetical protein|tara:strand:+ start:315 stop:650 length:336 start_codon:yes stop_codon:yes gene_type:complete
MASSTSSGTGALYGVGVYGTDQYGVSQLNLTMFPDGASGTGQVGSVTVSIVIPGVAITVTPNGVSATGAIGTPTITANIFDFATVKDNYERRRTVYVHRRSNDLDRTVKVA